MTRHLSCTVIGSWALPGWYEHFLQAIREAPNRFGAFDREEALRDAVRLAIDDQLRAGLDRITDGEMRRVDFNLGFYDHILGLSPLPRDRNWGAPAHDQRSKYLAVGLLKAPQGLGLVEEFRRFRELSSSACKIPVPGPFTLAGCIVGGGAYKNREEIAEALIPIVNAELKAVAAEGADFLQIDEPSFACRPDAPERFVEMIDATVAGVNAYISMHMCFGNYRARAVGMRSYAPLFPAIGKAKVNQVALEFASRELAEIDLLRKLPATMDAAVGLVDVKNSWIEPPELVAARLRSVLEHIEPDRVSITPDCGFSQTSRSIACAKAKSMVEGVRIVREELGLE